MDPLGARGSSDPAQRTADEPPEHRRSSTMRVSGSSIGRIPVSRSTVATQRLLEPDMGGVSAGSMMMKPIRAAGFTAGTSRFTCRKTPPRGSFSTTSRSHPSSAMKRLCAQRVAPAGGATPPTMTSPTSPSAWQLTTWMTWLARIVQGARRENRSWRVVIVYSTREAGVSPTAPRARSNVMISPTPRRRQLARWQRSLVITVSGADPRGRPGRRAFSEDRSGNGGNPRWSRRPRLPRTR